MKRKKSWLMLSIVLALLVGSAASLVLLLKYEPHFYRRCEVAEGPERINLAAVFAAHAFELGNHFDMRLSKLERPEEVIFSQDQINSFLEEGFGGWPDASEYKNRGISSPRICIDKDRLRLAFRYTNSILSTVVSLDLRIWVVRAQAQDNLFAVEILNRHVGALPVSAQSLQEEISALARSRKLEVTWYRHEGHPVALLRVQNSRNRAPAWVNRIDMQPGQLTIGVVPLPTLPDNAKERRPLPSPMGN